MKRTFSIAVALLAFVNANAQDVTAEAQWNLGDSAERVRISASLQAQAVAAKNVAWARAAAEGWTARGGAGQRMFELMGIRNNRPVFYSTDNVNAAISTAANLVRNTAPYNLNGSGLIAGVWDGGGVRNTHQEFPGGRVTILDGAGFADHSTHVGGTIGAAGTQAAALGMAPSVRIDSYEWTSDTAEMAARGMVTPAQTNNLPVSNHSYGPITGWDYGDYSGNVGWHWFGANGAVEDEGFGQYDADARTWDLTAAGAPYYLIFKSAGNDRNDGPPAVGETYYYYQFPRYRAKAYDPATDPKGDAWDNGGYDTIATYGIAKNIMTVGAVNDAVSGGSRNIANGTMSFFSCWGPADDGRIKPDIVANGVNLYSPLAGSDSAYANYSGTSMATPNACGSAALLVQWWKQLSGGGYPRSSTLKAVILHTADDLGNAGPDYQNGWGLMNTKAAADIISNHFGDVSINRITEQTLTTANPANTNLVTWDGTSPLRATLCWNDPAGTALSGLDNTNRILVNDLELRIVSPSGVTNYPFILSRTNPTAVATTGTNRLDNVEQVLISAPPEPGVYSVLVRMNGAISGGSQVYSLIISGITSNAPTAPVEFIVAGSPENLGSVSPAYGTNSINSGTLVSASAPNFSVNTATGLYTFAATGFVGTGSAPASGATNAVSFTLNAASSLTWQWALTDLVASNQTVTNPIVLNPRDTLVARDGFLVNTNGEANLRAGKSVRLQQGFRAAEGSRTRITAP